MMPALANPFADERTETLGIYVLTLGSVRQWSTLRRTGAYACVPDSQEQAAALDNLQ